MWRKVLMALLGSTCVAGVSSGQEPVRWVSITHDLATTDVISLAFADGVLYAGSWGGGVFAYDSAQEMWSAVNEGLDKMVVTDLVGDAEGSLYAIGWDAAAEDVWEEGEVVVRPPSEDLWQVIELGMGALGGMSGLASDPVQGIYGAVGIETAEGGFPLGHQLVFRITPSTYAVDLITTHPTSIFAFSDSGTVYADESPLSSGGILASDDGLETWDVWWLIPGNHHHMSAMTWHDGRVWAATDTQFDEVFAVESDGSSVGFPLPVVGYAPFVGFPVGGGRVNDIVIRGDGEVFVGRGYSGRTKSWDIPYSWLGVLRLSDERSGWDDVGNGLPGEREVRALVLGPDGVTMYAATGDGVYESTVHVPVELSGFSAE